MCTEERERAASRCVMIGGGVTKVRENKKERKKERKGRHTFLCDIPWLIIDGVSSKKGDSVRLAGDSASTALRPRTDAFVKAFETTWVLWAVKKGQIALFSLLCFFLV